MKSYKNIFKIYLVFLNRNLKSGPIIIILN